MIFPGLFYLQLIDIPVAVMAMCKVVSYFTQSWSLTIQNLMSQTNHLFFEYV